MMLRYAAILLSFTVPLSGLVAQVTLGNGDHVLEISGGISTYYNQRFLKPGETTRHKDRFRLRDAQVQFEGRYRNTVEYELQFDLADMAQGMSGAVDPENVGLMDAYVKFKPSGYFDITVGYAKLPYGRSSQVPFVYSPYWQRAEMLRGDVFGRRDIGVTLESSFCKQRALVQAGVYTGLGELSLRGDNDPSGNPEFVVRTEMAWPARYRKRDIDEHLVPVPMVVVGANARYMDKSQPAGYSLPAYATGEYGIKVIDGKRTAGGVDASFQYKGFSAQFEAHRIKLEPGHPGSVLFRGKPSEEHGGYVMAGGWVSQANWFSRKYRSIVSARYEEMNLNDLEAGSRKTISAAYAYRIRGFNCMVKAQYWHILEEETAIDALRWNEQVRVGVQYLFR